jgi:uncharacterized membrane protein
MGSGHSHAVEPNQLEVPGEVRRRLLAVIGGIALATIVGLVVLWPRGLELPDMTAFGVPEVRFNAEVIDVQSRPCPVQIDPTDPASDSPDFEGVESDLQCEDLKLTALGGPEEGAEILLPLTDNNALAEFKPGQQVVLGYFPPPQCQDVTATDAPECLKAFNPGVYYAIEGRERGRPMLALLALFVAAVVALGRWRGLASLVGLGISIAVLMVFVLPSILLGNNPMWVGLVGASAIAFAALYLAHGFNPLTHVALLGTLGSLALVALLSMFFVGATALSGVVGDDVLVVQAFGAELSFSGLLLAGVLIGALGALDDMTVTQASSVLELWRADPDLGWRELYRRAIRIGRDHIASTVNTLVLAYAGSSLALLLLFIQSDQTIGRVITSEAIATEVVRTLTGSIGLVASVPLTTFLAAILVNQHQPDEGFRATSDRDLEPLTFDDS